MSFEKLNPYIQFAKCTVIIFIYLLTILRYFCIICNATQPLKYVLLNCAKKTKLNTFSCEKE